jgi:4a-hydroxytetrahydrobiopterin dehydratase
MDGIRFTNRLAELAEKQQHHPLMVVDYAAVTVKTWTHTTNSLSEKDFMLAAGADKLSS